MENLRPLTGDDLAELNDNERSVVQFSMELANREASVHASPDEVEHDVENRSAQTTNSAEEADLVDKEKNPPEKETDFRLADFLPMRWKRTDFEFVEEIDPEKERRFSAKKNQNVRKLIFQSDPPSGFTFLIPASHQRPWTPPDGYACVYESWFSNCRLWWPLPELLTTYCSRREIALGQYTTNGIRIMVTLTVLADELGIKMSVRLFEDITTLSITAKTRFFYGKMVPKYNVITGKPTKINEASFEDPSVILNGYFNANIDRLGKWSQGCSDSFKEEVEAIRTLSHQHWPDISEACIQVALNRINRARQPESPSTRKKMGKLNLASLPSYDALIETPTCDIDPPPSPPPEALARDDLDNEIGSQGPSLRNNDVLEVRSPPSEPADETEMAIIASEPLDEHVEDPSLEGELPEEGLRDETQDLPPAFKDDEVVEYPHLVDFRYQHTEVPFVTDHETSIRLFRQIKLKSKGMPKLDELAKRGRYREMTRAGVLFFGSPNFMVRDYEMTIKAQSEKIAEKSRSLKRKQNDDQDVEMAENEKSRGDLLSKELEEMKAQKEALDSRLRRLDQERIEADSRFETTTKRLRDSREHEVMHVYEQMLQFLEEQPVIQHNLVLFSQAKGAREGLEKIQALGMSMDEVLEQVRADETRYSDELKEMEIIEASEINLQPIGLDEQGSNLTVFSPQDIEDLHHSD
ncbi:hypothetical protein N665_0180s0009 [Sinapis alba]|nr:hypothetical protein N665_0180s0009 [Sinapis alba]